MLFLRNLLRSSLLAISVVAVGSHTAFAESTPPLVGKRLEDYVAKATKRLSKEAVVAISVAETRSDKVVYEKDGERSMIPASVLKLITSVAALKYLGPDYHFLTELFVEREPFGDIPAKSAPKEDLNGLPAADVGTLYIRGYGDPSLVNEQVWNQVHLLKNRGVGSVNDIVIDDSLFIQPPSASGSDPYQAALSATSVNFNSYVLHITPTKVGASALVRAEPAEAIEVRGGVRTMNGDDQEIKLEQRPPSENYKVRESGRRGDIEVILGGTIGAAASPVVLYRTVPDPAMHFGTVFRAFLQAAGIEVRGKVTVGNIPKEAHHLMNISSRDLASIVKDLNQYSNNFIAGQVLFALGQDSTTGRFSQDLGLARVRELLSKIGIRPESYTILDGSGLDRNNRLAVRQLTRLLVAAEDDWSVGPVLISSLSRYGHSGTLKQRGLRRAAASQPSEALQLDELLGRVRADSVWGKTGTLDAVSSLVGYAVAADGRKVAFAIIINGEDSKPNAMEFEDGFVRTLIGIEK